MRLDFGELFSLSRDLEFTLSLAALPYAATPRTCSSQELDTNLIENLPGRTGSSDEYDCALDLFAR